jgi:hypothetical protein
MQQFTQPPILRGTERDQLVQIRQYLYQMSRDLNVALTSLTADNFSTGTEAVKVLSGDLSSKQQEKIDAGMGTLKSLIIKTADNVRAEIDMIEEELASQYVAASDFGTFSENINTQLTATAESLKQTIDYQATLASDVADVKAYKVDTEGYIKQGIIGYKEDGITPIIGIAIGQDIRTSGALEVGGKEYDIIDVTSNVSTWTPEKMSFRVNGVETAYVSNGAFYITTTLYFGNKWAISFEDGFSIRWIGG